MSGTSVPFTNRVCSTAGREILSPETAEQSLLNHMSTRFRPRCSPIYVSFSKLLSSPLIVLLIRGSSRPALDQSPEQASRPITCLIASLEEMVLSTVMLYLEVIQLLWEAGNAAVPRLETTQLLKTHLGGRR